MKKVLSLALAVLMVVSLSSVAFGALTMIYDKDTIPYDASDIRLGILGDSLGTLQPYNHYSSMELRTDEKYLFVLYAPSDSGYYLVNRDAARHYKMGVQIRASEGSKVVDTYKIVYKSIASGKYMTPAGVVTDVKAGNKAIYTDVAFVEVHFVKKFVSVDAQDVDLLIYLTENGKRLKDNYGNADADARITGEFENYYTEVDDTYDYVYTYDNAPVIKAQEYIKEIEVDMGSGISIFAKMFDDKKYYATVSVEVKEADEEINAKYPDIQSIYYLETIGLSSTGDVVSFSRLKDDSLFIYVQNADGDLVYIGKTSDRVPYFTKYFLSTKELPVDTTIEDLEDITPEEGGPNAGGDGPALENVNENPSTGR